MQQNHFFWKSNERYSWEGKCKYKKKKWISNKLLIIGSTNYPYARSTNYRDKNQIVHSPLADI